MATLETRIFELSNEQLEDKVRKFKGHILTMIHDAGSGHAGGSLSIVRALTVYFYRFHNGQFYHLSKGHAVPALYAILHELGDITDEELSRFREVNGLEGHANGRVQKVPSGSLGQGASVTNGYAIAEKRKGTNRKVYCFLGDGELQEGQVWEAFMTAGHNKLNVCYLIDNNKKQLSGNVADVKDIEPLEDKLRAFNIKVIHCENTIADITRAYSEAESYTEPVAVILNSKKGDGIPFMEEEKTGWHGKSLTQESYVRAMGILDLQPTTFREGKVKRVTNPIVIKAIERLKQKGYGLGEKSTRAAYGEWLVEAAEKYPGMIVLDGDLSESVKTNKFTKDRFYQIGISEQDMVGTAMGLAAMGYTPFVSTFVVFGRKPCDLVRTADIANLKIIYAFTHRGFIGEDGVSHQDTEDLGMWLGLYNIGVIGNPVDQFQARAMLDHAIGLDRASYIRLGRPDVPNIYSPEHKFIPGKADILREGNGIAILTTGQEVFESLVAAEILEEEYGINSTLVNVSYFRPFDEATILDVARKSDRVFTVEAHNPTTGLFSLVSQTLAKKGNCPPLYPIGTTNYVGSGLIEDLKELHGLSGLKIAETISKNI